MEQGNVSEIAQEILDHLRKHPQAQDTLEGIGQWWLPARMKSPAAAIKDALDELVDAGLITELLGKDAHISYRITDAAVLKTIDTVAACNAISSGRTVTSQSSLDDERSELLLDGK